jgi:serine/threonine-protein kinase
VFEVREPALARKPARARRWHGRLLITSLVSLLCLASIVWIYSRREVRRPQSIALLPFVDLSPDKTNEYFSDGLTEELTDALTRVQGLHMVRGVPPSSSRVRRKISG